MSWIVRFFLRIFLRRSYYGIVKTWHSGNGGPVEYEYVGSLNAATIRLMQLKNKVPKGMLFDQPYTHHGGFGMKKTNNGPWIYYYIVKEKNKLSRP